MSTKRLISIKATRTKLDKNGKPINVYRGGLLDRNKYARLTPSEKADREHLNDPGYVPERAKK